MLQEDPWAYEALVEEQPAVRLEHDQRPELEGYATPEETAEMLRRLRG